MDYIINHAILHVLNKNEVRFSDAELDTDSESVNSFIMRYVKKAMGGEKAKEATFNAESAVLAHVNAFLESGHNLADFKELSVSLGERMSAIIKENEDVAAADVLIVQFDKKQEGFIGIFKINYKECVTHDVVICENGEKNENHIISVPSLDGGKVDNAVIIPYEPMVLRVLEKPAAIDGEETFWFSQKYLECGAELSRDDAANIIEEVLDEINLEYFAESLNVEAKAKAAIIEEAAEAEGFVSTRAVAKKVFEDENVQNHFVELAEERGLKADAELGEKYAKRRFSSVRFKDENGIEVKIPTAVSDDTGIVEIVENEDGTVSIFIKNVRKA